MMASSYVSRDLGSTPDVSEFLHLVVLEALLVTASSYVSHDLRSTPDVSSYVL